MAAGEGQGSCNPSSMAGHSGTPVCGEGVLGVVPAFPSTPSDGYIFGTRLGSTLSKPWLLEIRRNDIIKGFDSHRCPPPGVARCP